MRDVGQPEFFEQARGLGNQRLSCPPLRYLRRHDIFQRREFRHQVMELIDKADMPAARQRALCVSTAHDAACDTYFAGIRRVRQPCDARAMLFCLSRLGQRCHHFTAIDLHAELMQHGEAVACS